MSNISTPVINITKGEISGPLNRDSISLFEKNYHQHVLAKANKSKVVINLADVVAVDTAGLAWLLLLMETAQNIDCDLSFIHIPDDLIKLASLSAVDTFLTSNT